MREHNLETDLEYADVDLFATRMRAGREHIPSWHGAHIYCLKHRDYEAAALIASRNLVHHSAVQFELEHPQVKSLSECESERAEMEYV